MFTFDDIIGYDDLKKHLQIAISKQKLAHAYIIEGAEGSGKKLIAGTLAKTLQCEAGGEAPCNVCVSCQTFDSGNHPDVIYVEQKKKKSIGVEEIRQQVQESIGVKPYKYPYKIYIIDAADKLTEQAQNALLKTIEEPPPYAMIFLLSKNSNSFLPTILSRCVILHLRPLSSKVIKEYLGKEEQIPDYQAELYARFASGAIGQAKQLASSEEFVTMRQDITDILSTLTSQSPVDRMKIADTMEKYKDRMDAILNLMMIWYRDILFYKEFGESEHIMNKDALQTISSLSVLSYEGILGNLERIEDTKKQLKRNTNFRLTMEILLLNLK